MESAPLTTGNQTIVAAFQSGLLHQLLLVLGLLALVLVAWNVLRGAQLRRALAGAPLAPGPTERPEAPARRLLRIGFGLLWCLDGILQAQASMPVGLADQVLKPAASGSPSWVVALVNTGVTIWDNHPISAAVSVVWIQLGIGIWLLVAPRGRWSQLGGLVSLGWGLVVWSFGEAFGAIFAPGLTVLFGAPGGVVFYCVAGALLAMPERCWNTARLGRRLLLAFGAFFVGMAVLQAWPGRGFWQGEVHGRPVGALLGMVDSMAATPQPGLFASLVRNFAAFDAAHGFAVNIVVVVVLGTTGALMCMRRPRLVVYGVAIASVFCLADWVLVEDLGFFGGLGTDPNNMVPIVLLLVVGAVAAFRPVPAANVAQVVIAPRPVATRLRQEPTYAFRSLAALGAALVVLLGVAPMAFASTNPNADPIVTEATDGTPQVTNIAASPFNLVDQNGRPVDLASLRGKAVALTFLDPVCTSDCPVIGLEFKQADAALGSARADTEFVAIVANPLYRSTVYTRAFDNEDGLEHVANWLYLTGSLPELGRVWNDYGVQVTVSPAGAMVDHSDVAFVLDRRGRLRYIINADPGNSSAQSSSFVDLLDDEVRNVLAQ